MLISLFLEGCFNWQWTSRTYACFLHIPDIMSISVSLNDL